MDTTRLGIVVSEFNYNITSRMLEQALKQAETLNAHVKYIFYVPGVFDMPLAIERMLNKDIDAIVTLGAVIKGDTKHDEVIAFNITKIIADLSLKHNKPISLGISGPGMSTEQAEERINSVSIRAINAAVNMVKRLKMLDNDQKVIR